MDFYLKYGFMCFNKSSVPQPKLFQTNYTSTLNSTSYLKQKRERERETNNFFKCLYLQSIKHMNLIRLVTEVSGQIYKATMN